MFLAALLLVMLAATQAHAGPVEELNQAITDIQEGREKKGKETLVRLINTHETPTNIKSVAYYMLAAREKDKSIAIQYINAAIDRDPSAMRNFELKGSILYELKRYTESIEALTSAIRLEPASDKLYSMRGLAYRDSGAFDLAITDLTRAVDMNSENALHRLRLAKTHYMRNDFKKCIDTMVKIEKEPDPGIRGDYLFLFAESLYSIDEIKKSEGFYKEALRHVKSKETRGYIQRRLASLRELENWNS